MIIQICTTYVFSRYGVGADKIAPQVQWNHLTVLVYVRRGRCIVMRTKTCSLAAAVACISLSICLGELDLVVILLGVDRGGRGACRDGGLMLTALDMGYGGINIERPMPFSSQVAVLVVDSLPRGE